MYRRLDAIKKIMPEGITVDEDVAFLDFSEGIREAVEETEFTLVFGAVLAVFTVFVFLRRARPTLIVATAIPISLIASFGLVWLFGHTLNTMTLLGMTLAVGVVIDDAIVVLENIERHREAGEDAYTAARTGTREIAFAATAATFSVAAVFVPVVFVEGVVGSFLGSFGVTVAGSVMISLFVALTLTPMLAARMKPPAPRAHGSIYHRLEQAFAVTESSYRRALDWTLAHRGKTIAIALSAFGVALVFGRALEGELFPSADEALIFAQIETAPGSSVEATLEYLERDEQWFLAQPEIAGMFSSVGETGPEGLVADEPGHAVRNADSAQRARAHRAGADPRGARGARRHPRPPDPDLQPGRDDARRLARRRDGDRAARQPAARGARAVGGRDDRAARRARRLRRPRPQPQARPCRSCA